MHHVVLERWSRGASALHRRDPRAKFAALLIFLVVLSTAHRALLPLAAAFLVLLTITLAWARVPVAGVLGRAAVVLPLTLIAAGVCWIGGDGARGLSLIVKSYLSAVAVLTVVSTTPLPAMLRGLERVGAPRFLLMVAQFLYRYLFLISEEAQHMRSAAASRASANRRQGFESAAGMLAVLFARSYARATEIHHAMMARAFPGRFHTLSDLRFGGADAWFLLLAAAAPIALRAAVERLA